jgi:hypothetical protein
MVFTARLPVDVWVVDHWSAGLVGQQGGFGGAR